MGPHGLSGGASISRNQPRAPAGPPAPARISLSRGYTDLQTLGASNRGTYWLNAYNRTKPDIIVLKAGAHVYIATNFEMICNEVLFDVARLRELGSTTQFVWKTQQPGGCNSQRGISVPPDEVAHSLRTGRFNWDRFDVRDLYAVWRVRQADHAILDLRMLYSRGDAHQGIECLHMC